MLVMQDTEIAVLADTLRHLHLEVVIQVVVTALDFPSEVEMTVVTIVTALVRGLAAVGKIVTSQLSA